jgi:hypothetical protein
LIDHLISHTAHAQYSQDIDPYDLGHEAGRIPALATYTSNQSQQRAAPWSKLAVQYDEGQILPDGIDDQALSFPFEPCFAHTSGLSPFEVLSSSKTEPANQLSSDNFPPPYQKPHHRGQGQNGRETADNLGADWGNSSASSRCVASPASSATSMNSAVSKAGRPPGSHLQEADRISAKEVRDRGACFRCWCMKEKVCNRNLCPNTKNWKRA